MTKNSDSKTRTNQAKVVEQTRFANHLAVSKYLDEVKFLPRLMGVNEADVWEKIEKLCELYENALTEARGKSEMLAFRLKTCCAKCKADACPEKKGTEDWPDD